MQSTATGKRVSKGSPVVVDDSGMMYYFGGGSNVDENGDYLDIPGFHLGPRTKESNPYSYDPLLQWRKYDRTPVNASAVYSDRLAQWDHNKYRSLVDKHFTGAGDDRGGDYFHSRSPQRIEAFLRDYNDNQDLELVRIEEHCNWSSGYPVWAFFYVDPNYVPPAPRVEHPKAQPAPVRSVKTAGINRQRSQSMRAKARLRKAHQA